MKMKRSRNLCYRLLLMLAVVFFALDVSAQTTINGQVKDDMGEAVIGASIVVKGTSNGTVTDFDGNFTLKCQSGAKLVITYIGYTPQEVAAKDGMQVTLKEDVAQLNEVVVVGYLWPRRKSPALWFRFPRISSIRVPLATLWHW